MKIDPHENSAEVIQRKKKKRIKLEMDEDNREKKTKKKSKKNDSTNSVAAQVRLEPVIKEEIIDESYVFEQTSTVFNTDIKKVRKNS